jgi:3-oxoacyl-[acyl-carrier-protein] synthase II
MAPPTRRVVLTGIGVVTPLGPDPASFWDGLQQGRSAVRTIGVFDPSALPVRIAGEILDFDPKKFIPKENKEGRKQIKVMARAIQLAVAAAQVALDHGKVDKKQLDPARFGVEFGAGLLPSELNELGPAAVVSRGPTAGRIDLTTWGEKGLANIPPLWMLKYLPNMHACHVSILHDAQGPNNSITEGDAGSLLALGEACNIIRRDQADFFLVGGADSKINPLSMVRQVLFGHLSKRNDAPQDACRPFDRGRDGIVVGEGAGVLVVEELGHARRRGATIYGEVAGCGAAFDRGMTGRGLARAIRAALAQANVTPDAIDHVNAHGLGSPRFDAAEAAAIAEVFGPGGVPVWSIKGNVGSLGAGAGTTELAASLLAVRHGTVPATRNHTAAGPDCPVAVTTAPRPVARPYFVKVGFADMGQCAAVVVRSPLAG